MDIPGFSRGGNRILGPDREAAEVTALSVACTMWITQAPKGVGRMIRVYKFLMVRHEALSHRVAVRDRHR